jgi:hypothetical protein
VPSAPGAGSPPARSRLLTRHFLTRLFDNDLVSPQADAHKSASMGLAGLATLATFVTIITGSKFILTPFVMPALNAVGYVDDALLYVTTSMILLALVAVVAWDGLALDARDEAILGPLPIPRAMIVRAKLAAMGVLAGAVLLALNGPPTVLHPAAAVAMLPVSVPGALRLMGAHAVATVAAGGFGFFTILALREVARAVLVGWWPVVSTRLQALLIVVLATGLLLMPAWLGGVAEHRLPSAATDWRVAASPPMWFVGLHEVLAGTVIVDVRVRPRLARPPLPSRFQRIEERSRAIHRGSRGPIGALALVAVAALAGATALAVGAFLWNARRPAARPRTPQRGGVPRPSVLGRLVMATVARAPDVRAGYFFALRTMARSVPHRAALAVAAAFGLALATIGFGRAMRAPLSDAVPSALLATQTLLIACILAGCEQAMRLPAHLPASWSLQLAWPADPRGYVAGVKRAIACGVGLPVLLVLLLAQLPFLGVARGIGHFAVGLLILLIAIEARFAAAHPLPFLTSYVAGGRAKLAPLWFVAAIVAAEAVAGIESRALLAVSSTLVLLGGLAALWAGLAWIGRRSGAPREDDLDLFQPQLDEATQLKL